MIGSSRHRNLRGPRRCHVPRSLDRQTGHEGFDTTPRSRGHRRHRRRHRRSARGRHRRRGRAGLERRGPRPAPGRRPGAVRRTRRVHVQPGPAGAVRVRRARTGRCGPRGSTPAPAASPSCTGAAALHGGALHRFPGGPLDSLRTTLLTAREKVCGSRRCSPRCGEPTRPARTASRWLGLARRAGRDRSRAPAARGARPGRAPTSTRRSSSPPVPPWRTPSSASARACGTSTVAGSRSSTSCSPSPPAAGSPSAAPPRPRCDRPLADGSRSPPPTAPPIRAETAVIAAGGPDAGGIAPRRDPRVVGRRSRRR